MEQGDEKRENPDATDSGPFINTFGGDQLCAILAPYVTDALQTWDFTSFLALYHHHKKGIPFDAEACLHDYGASNCLGLASAFVGLAQTRSEGRIQGFVVGCRRDEPDFSLPFGHAAALFPFKSPHSKDDHGFILVDLGLHIAVPLVLRYNDSTLYYQDHTSYIFTQQEPIPSLHLNLLTAWGKTDGAKKINKQFSSTLPSIKSEPLGFIKCSVKKRGKKDRPHILRCLPASSGKLR
jgi:hypothetical protein